jgi:hypothetical protein
VVGDVNRNCCHNPCCFTLELRSKPLPLGIPRNPFGSSLA